MVLEAFTLIYKESKQGEEDILLLILKMVEV
jgi:hypothetical protein